MAGNNSIQILRGSGRDSSETLLPGQPYYDYTNNKLYIGGENDTPINQARAIGNEVTSVNGKTGDVTISKSDVGLSNVANVRQYSAENPPPEIELYTHNITLTASKTTSNSYGESTSLKAYLNITVITHGNSDGSGDRPFTDFNELAQWLMDHKQQTQYYDIVSTSGMCWYQYVSHAPAEQQICYITDVYDVADDNIGGGSNYHLMRFHVAPALIAHTTNTGVVLNPGGSDFHLESNFTITNKSYNTESGTVDIKDNVFELNRWKDLNHNF